MKRKLLLVSAVLVALAAYASTFTINSTFNSATGNGPCGVSYNGLANYTKAPPAWGWKLDPNAPVHTISVPTNAIVEYGTKLLRTGCGVGSVTVTGTATDKFRFTVYWPTANGTPPTGDYQLTLTGFLP